MNRIVAILHNNDNMNDNVHAIVKMMLDNACASQVYVFTAQPDVSFNIANGTQICMNITWPVECDNISKIRNWINNFFKTNNFKGILHVLEDTTNMLKNPISFMSDLENMMEVFDYDVWFSTICDKCNYIYSKYNPRLAIILDKVEYFKFNLGKKLLLTSHSNTQWIAYNFAKVPDDLLKFNEDFSIAMFYIIEFLARRRNTKKQNQVYFMNQYLTIPSEKGVFETIEIEKNVDSNNMAKEDALFKEKKIDFSSDNNIDFVLETIYNKLNSKL